MTTGNPHFTLNWNGDGQTIYVGQQHVPRVPMCGTCKAKPAAQNTPNHGLLCVDCFRPVGFVAALELLIITAPPDLRSSIYKRLSAVYHPDAGCADPMFMTELNRLKDRHHL